VVRNSAPCWLIIAALFSSWVDAGQRPRIALIIDDLGNRASLSEQAIRLPGAITYAILPHTPHASALADLAHALGKEVILHLPMQPLSGVSSGPGELTVHMTHQEFVRSVDQSLSSIPHVCGVNNHMGSLLTQHPGSMAWLMDVLADREGFYFIDSRTTSKTVAARLAMERGIPYARRDVFLDHELDVEEIAQQFQRGVELAKKNGHAVIIGHPHPQTLEVLERELHRLVTQGVELVFASTLTTAADKTAIDQISSRRLSPWHVCLSP